MVDQHNTMPINKTKRFESRRYLDWVKGLACCMCDRPADDPHHIKHIGHLSGGATSAPDSATIPLCRSCHDGLHANPALWPLQWEYLARTLLKAIDDGVLKLSTKGEHV